MLLPLASRAAGVALLCAAATPRSSRCPFPPRCVELSSAFAEACESQFEILAESIPSLRRAAIFVRSENKESGSLEFVPVAVWPSPKVFFVGLEGEARAPSSLASLPGKLDATEYLADYPFLPPTRSDGAASCSPMADGGLSVPLAYRSDTLGVLALWRERKQQHGPALLWRDAECRQAERVARTLAVAAALDQASTRVAPPGAGEAAVPAARDSDRIDEESHELLLREVRALLSASVHQLNSPLSAVRTLSKLLLRRLDGASDTMSRELARDILIQSERLSELIQPIDRLAVSLPASTYETGAAASSGSGNENLLDDGGTRADHGEDKEEDVVTSSTVDLRKQSRKRTIVPPPPVAPFLLGASPAAISSVSSPSSAEAAASPASPEDDVRVSSLDTATSTDDENDDEDEDEDVGMLGAEICFVGDVLRPIAMLAARLAPEYKVDHVYVSIDEEDRIPGVQAPEAAIREATTNLIDNALKYCRGGDASGGGGSSGMAGGRRSLAISCDWNSARSMVLIEVWNSCPTLEPEELVGVLEWGQRGASALEEVQGSGFGLPIASQLVALLGGELELINAPMPQWAWAEQQQQQQQQVEVAEQSHGEHTTTGVSARIWLPRHTR